MTYHRGHQSVRCKAHKTDGSGQCNAWAIMGGRVCVAHGGRAPQVKRNARQRMDDMVAPALTQLRRLIDSADSDASKLRAIENVLDRTGYKLPERIESDNAVTIRVEYETLEQVPARVIEHHYQLQDEQLQNGATNGKSKTD